jgi:hypothetical protein
MWLWNEPCWVSRGSDDDDLAGRDISIGADYGSAIDLAPIGRSRFETRRGVTPLRRTLRSSSESAMFAAALTLVKARKLS